MSNSKSILIVAAERGLGLGLAKQFFDRGWRVVGTFRSGTNIDALLKVGGRHPERLTVRQIDVVQGDQINSFEDSLTDQSFDVIFMNAGIYGALHQSVLEATPEEVSEIMMTNAFGPIRLARRFFPKLVERGTLCFMSSHRASIAGNVEGGLELYRASKAALNMLSRGIYADHKDNGYTVLNIHPGWVNTDMGTLGGTVAYEIELEPSVRGVADVVERHMGSGEQLFLDYRDEPLAW